MLICALANECSGCAHWGTPLEVQTQDKVRRFKELAVAAGLKNLPAITVNSLGPAGLRDRLDFTIENGRFGLRAKNSNQIVDLPECLQLSGALQKFLSQFRKILPPIAKGSVRLRTYQDPTQSSVQEASPPLQQGVWLDFSHKDIQFLFHEQTSLRQLLEIAYVEVGQRRKKLVWQQDPEPRLRLQDPELHPWANTYDQNPETPVEIPLWGYVSSFTQTGNAANKKISQLISDWVKKLRPQTVFEFGAGLGTLTLPIKTSLAPKTQLSVFEQDSLSLEGLKKTLSLQASRTQIEIFQGDYQRHKNQLGSAELIVLNPPRSGVGQFLQLLDLTAETSKTQAVIYMSCFAESLIQDSSSLAASGFILAQIEMLDQFPQTDHAEWLTLWRREKKP